VSGSRVSPLYGVNALLITGLGSVAARFFFVFLRLSDHKFD
jgi:hypothetical protein